MKYGIIPVLLLLFMLSCNKEVNFVEPQPATDPIPQFAVTAQEISEPSSRLLKREISYTQNNPLLKNVRLFTYDNANRCTEIKIGTIDSSIANPVFVLKQTLSFTYDGSALLPSSFSSVKTVFPNLVTTFYYKYNSQGRKISDSVRVKNQAGDPADRVINYVYDYDKVYATPVLTGFSMENNSLDTLLLLTRGNIEKLVSRIIRAAGDQIVTYTFTYDQSVSPYNKLNIANSLYFESAALGIGYNVPLETHYMGVTTNNMTSWTTGNYTVRFSYLYNQDQYPVRKEMYLPGDINPYQVMFFEY